MFFVSLYTLFVNKSLNHKHMKQLKNLKFREDVKILSVEQMKALKGGGTYCHCMNESGSHEASSCDECISICSGGVQNCNTY